MKKIKIDLFCTKIRIDLDTAKPNKILELMKIPLEASQNQIQLQDNGKLLKKNLETPAVQACFKNFTRQEYDMHPTFQHECNIY